MQEPFSHPYLSSVRWQWTTDLNGGGKRHAMIIVPNVTTDPEASGFDQKKLNDLTDAAVMYAKRDGSLYLIYLVDR